MSKLLSAVLFCLALAGPALATPRAAPTPEIDAGILGMMAAGGVVYLLKRRNRSRT